MFSENIINLTCCIIIKMPAFRVDNPWGWYWHHNGWAADSDPGDQNKLPHTAALIIPGTGYIWSDYVWFEAWSRLWVSEYINFVIKIVKIENIFFAFRARRNFSLWWNISQVETSCSIWCRLESSACARASCMLQRSPWAWCIYIATTSFTGR